MAVTQRAQSDLARAQKPQLDVPQGDHSQMMVAVQERLRTRRHEWSSRLWRSTINELSELDPSDDAAAGGASASTVTPQDPQRSHHEGAPPTTVTTQAAPQTLPVLPPQQPPPSQLAHSAPAYTRAEPLWAANARLPARQGSARSALFTPQPLAPPSVPPTLDLPTLDLPTLEPPYLAPLTSPIALRAGMGRSEGGRSGALSCQEAEMAELLHLVSEIETEPAHVAFSSRASSPVRAPSPILSPILSREEMTRSWQERRVEAEASELVSLFQGIGGGVRNGVRSRPRTGRVDEEETWKRGPLLTLSNMRSIGVAPPSKAGVRRQRRPAHEVGRW